MVFRNPFTAGKRRAQDLAARTQAADAEANKQIEFSRENAEAMRVSKLDVLKENAPTDETLAIQAEQTRARVRQQYGVSPRVSRGHRVFSGSHDLPLFPVEGTNNPRKK